MVYLDIDDADAVKVSIATVAAQVVYSGADLDGLLGANTQMQQLTVTTAASVGSYTLSEISILGTDQRGRARTVTATLTQANGGETLEFQSSDGTDVGVLDVTSITIPAMVDAAGAFTFGVADVIFDEEAKEIRGGAGNVAIVDWYSRATLVPCVAGEHHSVFVKKIMDVGTTAFPVMAYL